MMDTNKSQCMRMRPYFRNVGLMGIVMAAAMGSISVYVAYFNVDGSFRKPIAAAATFGLFWTCFVMLGVWLVLAYRRYRLILDETCIRQIGVVTDRTVSLAQVEEMKWRRFPAGGSVRLSAPSGVLKVDLGNLAKDDRKVVIAALRDHIDERLQVDWDRFHEQFKQTPQRRARQRRVRWMLVGVFGFHAVVFSMFALGGLGGQYYVAASVNAVMTGYLIRSQRRLGHPSGAFHPAAAETAHHEPTGLSSRL